MPAFLTIEGGQETPQVYTLQTERNYTLGRNRNNVIVLHDEHASRWHAEILSDQSRWVIRDLGTLNGTRVNGDRIHDQATLQHGHVIHIGTTRLRFSLEEEGVLPLHYRTPPVPETSAWEDDEEDDEAPGAEGKKDSESGLTPSQMAELGCTVLHVDELTALCEFMASSVKDNDPAALITRALTAVLHQTRAGVAGFLNLDAADPLPKIVLPKLARVDMQLSRKLTQEVQKQDRPVWLGGQPGGVIESDSLLHFKDAICLPLRSGPGAPLGALHAYKAEQLFSEHQVRFCEVLAGHLANSLCLLRSRRSLEAENRWLRAHAPEADELVGDGPGMTNLRTMILRAAQVPATVLVTGETGVGKELVATALHYQGPRRDGPFVPFNCAAVAASLVESELFGFCKGAHSEARHNHPGLFKQADEGTLFLDEVGELSLECQAKLLRVIEGKGFRPLGATQEIRPDVRVVAATNRDLAEEVKAGRFRKDLHFRLQVVQIKVPPLREHREDIPEMVDYFLQRLAKNWGRKLSVSAAAVRRLTEYGWPGNVRQLRSVLESAATLSGKAELGPDDLFLTDGPVSVALPTFNLEELEAEAIRQALRATQRNITQTARLLGITRDTLHNKIRRYSIDKETL